MRTIIHVNQHVIRANVKNNENNPPLTVKTYKDNRQCHEAVAYDQNGIELFRVIHRPNDPLPCGARVWIQTQHEVRAIEESS